jgi:uncharacterized protein YndB with AHSA1/START domain
MSTTTIEPIVKTVTVNGPPEHAFRVFTERIAEWWPFERHSVAGEMLEDGSSAVSAEFRLGDEGRGGDGRGGRLVEAIDDGREAEWARILAWDPPRRLVLAWHPGRPEGPSTEIEVTFAVAEDEPGRTAVRLEHRGWEALGERAAAAREGYEEWGLVLGRYAGLANAA